MKKIVIISLVIALLLLIVYIILPKKHICTLSTTTDSIITDSTVVLTYRGEYVIKKAIETVYTFENEENAINYYNNLLQNNILYNVSQNGKKVTVTLKDTDYNFDEVKISVTQKQLEDLGYTCG